MGSNPTPRTNENPLLLSFRLDAGWLTHSWWLVGLVV